MRQRLSTMVEWCGRTRACNALFRPRQTTLAWRLLAFAVLGSLVIVGILTADHEADRRIEVAEQVIDVQNDLTFATATLSYEACKDDNDRRADRAELDRRLVELDQRASDERERFIMIIDAATESPEADVFIDELTNSLDLLRQDIEGVLDEIDRIYDPSKNPDCEVLNPGAKPEPASLN